MGNYYVQEIFLNIVFLEILKTHSQSY